MLASLGCVLGQVKKVEANQIFHSILKPAFTLTALGVMLVLAILKISSRWFPQAHHKIYIII